MTTSEKVSSKMPSDEDDFLGYAVYADTLWARITQAINKDQKNEKPVGDDPLVVGLFGEWGAGKSKLLSLIQRRAVVARDESIKNHQYNGYKGLIIPVFFQPWKYEHEQHLLVPMLLHILAALEETLTKARNADDKLTGAAHQVLGAAVGGIGKLVKGVKDVVGAVDPASSAALHVAEIGAAHLGKPKPSARLAKKFEHQGNGRSYYEMHSILKAITRPAKRTEIVGDQHHDKDFPVNFVIFIDDLDRCLPEKAVATLELIKTIFNLESFAFVLALDEEVVERGIGHRYQAYVLEDRKPEMPITGFEYLEKIVHLPFRLPALTRAQAADFVRRYEIGIEPDGSKRWFAPEWPEKSEEMGKQAGELAGIERRLNPREQQMDLLGLALDGFDDVFVPRKLVRMVELMHQIAAVAQARGRPLGWSVETVDVRVVLAIMLIQLFQPELYRLIRRRKTALPSLLAAFAANGNDKIVSADVSDHNLRQWALYKFENFEDITEASQNMAAEQTRLPLIEQIGEYRRAQRHGFNVLKLMQALAKSMDANGSKPEALTIGSYFSLLGAQANAIQPAANAIDGYDSPHAAGVVARVTSSQGQSSKGTGQVGVSAFVVVDTRPRHMPRDLQALFRSLVSPDQVVQANLAGENNLPVGFVLESSAVAELLEMVKAWQGADGDRRKKLKLLFRGLQVLAPYVPRSGGKSFWDLVKDIEHGGELGDAVNSLEQLKEREAWADLRAAIGQEDRFDPSKPWLCRARYSANTSAEEPLPGFVRIPAGGFVIGHQAEADNQPWMLNLESDFLIARHLTTVAQFARFIDAGGYGQDSWWDAAGKEWREGSNSETTSKLFKEHQNLRGRELRLEPMNWQVQVGFPSRPIVGICWFEARAYCRWLTQQLQSEVGFPSGYLACLPSEAQWEKAARSKKHDETHQKRWVWGDERSLGLRANTLNSGFNRAVIVGLFAETDLGISDLAGNVWQYTDTIYSTNSMDYAKHCEKDRQLVVVEDVSKSEIPVVRGGAWSRSEESAAISFRDMFHPDNYGPNVGFRVAVCKRPATITS